MRNLSKEKQKLINKARNNSNSILGLIGNNQVTNEEVEKIRTYALAIVISCDDIMTSREFNI